MSDCLRRLRRTIRGRRAVCSSEELPNFLSDPDWSNQQINRSLKKRGMIAFDAVAKKEQDPAADKKGTSQNPLQPEKKDEAEKNQGDADAVKKLVPDGRMFVVVLRHVVGQAGQKATPGGGDLSAGRRLYTEKGPQARGGHTYRDDYAERGSAGANPGRESKGKFAEPQTENRKRGEVSGA